MAESVLSRSTINVHRFRIRYGVARDHPNPENLQQRMDDCIVTSLPQALGSLTAGLGQDEAVVLIRRLELDFALNTRWDRARAAQRWAGHILRELFLALHTEGDNGIARYPNRAAFVARFLADLVQGQAWGKWYYRQFDGLRLLPVSAALRTAMCNPDNQGSDALLMLPEWDLVKVIHVLTPQDARRILGYLAGQEPDGAGVDTCLEVFLSLFKQRPDLALPAENDVSAALRLYLESRRKRPGLSGPLMMTLALATACFTRYLVEHSPAQGRALIKLLISGDKVALYRHFGADAEHWMPLLEAPAAPLEALGHLVMERCHATTRVPPVLSQAPRHTRFGGLFLLLPLLDDLPVSEITKDWPAPEGTSASALLRLLLVLKGLGQSRTATAFFDPVVRDLLTIAPAVMPAMLADWQGSLSQQRLKAGLQRFCDWQQAIGIAGDENLVLIRVPLSTGPVVVLLDCAGGWLAAEECGPGPLEPLVRRICGQVPATAGRLLADRELVGLLEAEHRGLEVLALDDERLTGLAQACPGVAATLSRLDRLENEWSFLALPKPFLGPGAADLTFSLMAHGLLRALARRLPGFDRSSVPYLYDNFLDFGATVEAEESRYVVRLERPPLHIVLNLTGMTRRRYRLSWGGERVVEHYQTG